MPIYFTSPQENQEKLSKKILPKKNLEYALLTYAQILDGCPGSIYWKDINGVYLGRNSFAAQIMYNHKLLDNTDPESIIGKTDFDLFDIKTAAQHQKQDRRVMATKKPITAEETTTLPSGRTLYFISTKKPLFDESNSVVGVLCISIDITEQKHLKQELQQAKLDLAIQKLGITPRELDCIDQLLLGKTATEMAKILNISPRTAETHLEHIKNKLGCFKKSELITKLIKIGFTQGVHVL